jgi:serine O-acetyltransferase
MSIVEVKKISYKYYNNLVKADLYRYTGKVSFSVFLRNIFLNAGFKYSFWMRTAAFLKNHLALHPAYIISRLMLMRYTYKYGIDIPYNTAIGSGLYIGHFGGIIINWNTIIGENCNLSPGVVIGQSNRGDKRGCPLIGDNVFIGPGAKIIGKITIGNNVAIGANCVVTQDIPDNAVVAGVPGRIISYDGAQNYINRIDY